MPFSLRLQLSLETHKRLFHDVPFLRQIDSAIVLAIIQRMEPVVVSPLEVVVECGAPPKGLFFIRNGRMEVLSRDGEGSFHRINVLESGDFFGEVSLLVFGVCTATVRAMARTLHFMPYTLDLISCTLSFM